MEVRTVTPAQRSAQLISGGGLRHVAFIMDGNGRWAKKRGLPRAAGHKAGAEAFRRVAHYCRDIGLKYVTVYAFSTENWSRPEAEVKGLMLLLRQYLDEIERTADKEKTNIRFIGDLSVFDRSLQKRIADLTERTSVYPAVLNVALNYGGRAELAHAFTKLAADGKREITADDISSALYTAGQPDPDLIVRTAGEERLSNFLIWQSAYSEFYFTDVLWPDMTERDVDAAVEEFFRRTRRFGGVVESEK